MTERQTPESLQQPGIVVLFGSGETSASGQKAFDWLFRHLKQPLRVAVLETPAGFELNSDRVAGRIGDFLCDRLQNYRPEVTLVPARQRGTPFSPDSPEIVAPLLPSNVLFLGPGSPTYAVRQLRDSLAWHTLQARHRLGAALALASAATLAVGCLTLPVYEIYKVGEDLHWKPGLDLFGPLGLSLVILPHWNNKDGGGELDTSRCFMGQARFDRLFAMLPAGVTVLGLYAATGKDIGAGDKAGLVRSARHQDLQHRAAGDGGIAQQQHGGGIQGRDGFTVGVELLAEAWHRRIMGKPG